MTTTNWTTRQRELSNLFTAFCDLLYLENDLRLKRIEDKLDQLLHERRQPWTASSKPIGAEKQGVDEKMPILTDNGLIRLAQIRKYFVPVSSATWWRWVRDGRAPPPVKLGRITAWRSSDIRAFLNREPTAADK